MSCIRHLSYRWILVALVGLGAAAWAAPAPAAAPALGMAHSSFFDRSPDGRWVIFFRDANADGAPELHRAAVDAADSATLQLSPDLSIPGGAVVALVSPDSQQVAYRDGIDRLYSVPMAGGAPRLLSLPLPADGQIFEPQISPDSQWVVYGAPDSGGRRALYRARIDGGLTEQLSQALAPAEEGEVSAFAFGGASVVYLLVRGEQSEVYSAPLSGGPSRLLGAGSSFRIAPSGQVVLVNDAAGALRAVPIGGGPATPLAPEGMAAGFYTISPDSSFVALNAYPPGDRSQSTILRVPIGGGPAATLSDPDDTAWSVAGIWVSPDSQWVVYVREPIDGGEHEMAIVRPSGADRRAIEPPPARLRGWFDGVQVTITGDSRHVIYAANAVTAGGRRIYRAALGSGRTEPLSPAEHSEWLFYQADAASGWIIYTASTAAGQGFFSLPIGGGPALPAGPIAPYSVEPPSAQLRAGSPYVVYSAPSGAGYRLVRQPLLREAIYLPYLKR